MRATAYSALQLLVISTLLILVWAVYLPGLSGPFIFDDAHNITLNSAIKVDQLDMKSLEQAAFSIPAGPLYRPISFISFAINYYFFELDPFAFKLTNLIIHLGTGAAVFWCAYLLYGMFLRLNPGSGLQSRKVFWAALLVAAVFLLHPFNVSSVLYVVQRMNSLAAFFMFLSLGFYLLGRSSMLFGGASGRESSVLVPMLWWFCALLFFPLAIFSKENAILLPFFVLVIEGVLLNWQAESAVQQRIMKLVRLLLWLGVVIVLATVFIKWDWIVSGYLHRDFSLIERLLTEPHILFRYLSLILVPINRGMTFYHDDIVVSSSLLDGNTYLYVLFWVVLSGLGFLLRRRAKWFAFGVFWFLVGHSMESSFIALELAHEHRNYTPMFGILLALGSLLARSTNSSGSGRLYIGLALVAVLVVAASTYVRTGAWANMGTLVERQQRLNPESPRANYAVGQYLFARLLLQESYSDQEIIYQQILPYFEAVNNLDKTDVAGYLGLIRLNDQMGYKLNKEWLNEVVSRAGSVPLGQTDMSHVQDLLHCQLNQYCSIDTQALKAIADAVLSNPSLPYGYEATVKADLGVYLSMQDMHAEAAHYLVDVVAIKPDWWVFRLAALNSLVSAEQYSKALNLLEEAKSMGVPEELQSSFNDMEKKIRFMEKNPG